MAYVYMPLIFTLLGYGTITIAAAPFVPMLQATGGMLIAEEAPRFNQELKSIFQPNASKEAVAAKQEKSSEQAAMTGSNTEIEIPEKSNTVSMKSINFPDHGTHYAEVSCDRIQLKAPVYWGDTDDILKVGVGQFMGSFLPGFDRSILLSGHNTTFFKPLQLVEEDDIITLRTNYGEYRYQVMEVTVILAEDAKKKMDELLSYEKEKLILYTCYPFETLLGTKQERLFVFADIITGPKVE
jgi:sortase A